MVSLQHHCHGFINQFYACFFHPQRVDQFQLLKVLIKLITTCSQFSRHSLNGISHFHSSQNESDHSKSGLLSTGRHHHHLTHFVTCVLLGNTVLLHTVHLAYTSSPLLPFMCGKMLFKQTHSVGPP